MDRNIDYTCSSVYRNVINALFNLSVYLSIVKTKQKKAINKIKFVLFDNIRKFKLCSLTSKVLACAYQGLKNMCVRAIVIVVQRFGV